MSISFVGLAIIVLLLAVVLAVAVVAVVLLRDRTGGEGPR